VVPRRGEWLLVDREHARAVERVLSLFPTKETHGVMVIPTPHGSMLLGPTADDIEDKTDRSTHKQTIDQVFEQCAALVPSLRREHVIKTFAGLRTHSVPTYRVGPSEVARNVIQVAGIRSTGVSSSPAMGDHVRDLLAEVGLEARPDPSTRPELPRRLRLGDAFDCDLLATDPLGRTVVCACEKVTAREIHDSLTSALPARSIAGIARRTHATWGRCQGSACLSGVSFIASLHLGVEAAWAIPFAEAPSTLGVAETRRA
jgi:glycerol-3-phosphate dehydrogenase